MDLKHMPAGDRAVGMPTARDRGPLVEPRAAGNPAGVAGPVQPRRQSASPARVELEIDELRLHGFDAADRYRIGDAVQRELTRLLEQEGIPARIGGELALQSIDAGAIQLAGAAHPDVVGERIARTIYGGLRR